MGKKGDFDYSYNGQISVDEDRDCFVCPAGHSLELKGESNDGKKVYQAIKDECDACAPIK